MPDSEVATSSAQIKVDDLNDPPRWLIGTVVVPYVDQRRADRMLAALERVRREFDPGAAV